MIEPFNNVMPDPADAQREDAPREDLLIRPAPQRVSGLRRPMIRLAIALLAVIVAAALIVGLGIDFHGHDNVERGRIEPPPENLQPSSIADLPSSYADLPRRPSAPPAHTSAAMHDMHHEDSAAPMAMVTDARKEDLARLLASIQQVGRKNQELAQQIATYKSQAAQAQAKVWGSSLFFKIDQMPDRLTAELGNNSSPRASDTLVGTKTAAEEVAVGTPTTPATTPPQSPTDQQRKLAFLNDEPAPSTALDPSSLSPAPGDANANGYLLQAGTVVPAALLTGINTDLPGDIVATVTQGVYDSPTGNHLLIPQGARLYGSYDSQVSPSQNRALLVWHRLLLPDGQSMNLDRMRGTDAAGYAGVSDQVDYHLDKLTTAALLSGVIAYAGNLAGGRQTLTVSPAQVVGDTIAQQASTVGSNIVQRQLNVQPTITIRPGWPVRVMVNRDFLLPPYMN